MIKPATVGRRMQEHAFVPIADRLHMLRGPVNVYLLEIPGGVALIDTGFPDSEALILAALAKAGRAAQNVKHIILTHGHPDHMGSAAALKRLTGATVWAHPLDREIIERGTGFRAVRPSPGLKNRILTAILTRWITEVEPTLVDETIEEGQSFPFAPELIPVHAPGHSAGQLTYLWQPDGGVMITGDACVNFSGMALPASVEDLDEARRSLAKIGRMTFDKLAFGHGPPLLGDADAAFRKVWNT